MMISFAQGSGVLVWGEWGSQLHRLQTTVIMISYPFFHYWISPPVFCRLLSLRLTRTMPAKAASAAASKKNSAPKSAVSKKVAKKGAPAAAAKPTKVVKVTKRKAYTRPQFRRPHTYRRPATVKPSSNVSAIKNKWDAFRIIRYPLTTDKAMKKIEENNTLTFIVDSRANKTEIKKAIRKLYQVKTVKVNTLIRPDGLKKAYIRLSASYDALDTANKMGLV
ncbi:60S ribosomal protein L23a, putative [Trypanosoma brucei brucei TREU927]|nr:60S ribosomal protein L23a, putative [Trypanosoma brucei brucei TREU927]AAX79510.1 60S ribosomal protein L23a, putative [Trypanosoma brucei]AAZ12582.1 60S ribosomal protein L23a, putative [Trypanosoma brucei brucei TREU927]